MIIVSDEKKYIHYMSKTKSGRRHDKRIADKENIKVENSDIEKLFLNIKDDKEREKAKENSYYYASILRKQKTIDFLISL